MKARTIGRALGGASVLLGILDVVKGPRFARVVGSEGKGNSLFRAVGGREIATGVAGLVAPKSPWPARARLGGDVIDLVAVGVVVAKPDNSKRRAAAATFALVAGVALIDWLAARRLAQGG